MTMPFRFPVEAPVKNAREPDPIPSRYVSIKRTQECACCHLVHQWCELFAYVEEPSHWGFKQSRNHHRLDWSKQQPLYRIPIEQREDPVVQIIPFCHDCNQPSLMQSADMLDPPPPPKAVLHIYQPPPDPAKPTKTKAPKEELPISAIMDMLK